MHAAHAMLRSWTPQRSRTDEATAHMVCMVEEIGEAIDEADRDNPPALMMELADVIIAANMMHIGLAGRPIHPFMPPAFTVGDTQDRRLMQLAASGAKVAKIWRSISGMRSRASSKAWSLDDLHLALCAVVGRVHVVTTRDIVPVDDKLDDILSRGKGLSTSELGAHTQAVTHRGGKPGTVHWG